MATIQVGDRVCLGNSYKAVSHFVGEVNKNNFKKTTRVDMVYIYIELVFHGVFVPQNLHN